MSNSNNSNYDYLVNKILQELAKVTTQNDDENTDKEGNMHMTNPNPNQKTTTSRQPQRLSEINPQLNKDLTKLSEQPQPQLQPQAITTSQVQVHEQEQPIIENENENEVVSSELRAGGEEQPAPKFDAAAFIAKHGTKSAAIRALRSQNYSVAMISKMLDIRYQHVRNVLLQKIGAKMVTPAEAQHILEVQAAKREEAAKADSTEAAETSETQSQSMEGEGA
jgi:hypothetical protein